MDLNYIKNCVLSAPGLAIYDTSSPLVKNTNAFRIKTEGLISVVKAAGKKCPSLAESKGIRGADSTVIPAGYYRVYTLLAKVGPTGGVEYNWVHSDDIPNYTITKTEFINKGNKGDEKKAIVGFVVIFNKSLSDFDPGTTDLDASDIEVEYIDNFGYIGM
jgi:hypothetical protein